MKHISEQLSLSEKRAKAGKKGGKNKKGSKSLKVLDREKALELWRQGVINRSQGLLTVQSILALGSIRVFRIDTHWEDSPNGKTKYKVKSKPKLVENVHEIERALDYEYGNGEDPNDDSTYYFVTTKDPDIRAIDSMMDRTFGRAKESLELIPPPSIDPEEAEKANEVLRRFIYGSKPRN